MRISLVGERTLTSLVRQNALYVVSEYRPEIASTVDDASDFDSIPVEAVKDNHWFDLQRSQRAELRTEAPHFRRTA